MNNNNEKYGSIWKYIVIMNTVGKWYFFGPNKNFVANTWNVIFRNRSVLSMMSLAAIVVTPCLKTNELLLLKSFSALCDKTIWKNVLVLHSLRVCFKLSPMLQLLIFLANSAEVWEYHAHAHTHAHMHAHTHTI